MPMSMERKKKKKSDQKVKKPIQANNGKRDSL
jgi:hypothetical protein